MPDPRGGFTREGTPNPNDAMATYKRGAGSVPVGAYAGGGDRTGTLPPFLAGSGESALSANLGLLQRAKDTRAAYDMGEVDRRAQAGNTGLAAIAPLAMLPMDQRFDALLQALAERGVSKLSTGAAHFRDAPGFFDQQNPDSQAQQARADTLRLQDISRLMDAMRQQGGRR